MTDSKATRTTFDGIITTAQYTSKVFIIGTGAIFQGWGGGGGEGGR